MLIEFFDETFERDMKPCVVEGDPMHVQLFKLGV